MAKRPAFFVHQGKVVSELYSFEWYPGFEERHRIRNGYKARRFPVGQLRTKILGNICINCLVERIMAA